MPSSAAVRATTAVMAVFLDFIVTARIHIGTAFVVPSIEECLPFEKVVPGGLSVKAIVRNGVIGALLCAGMGTPEVGAQAGDQPFELVEVAQSDRQWTGVAVSKEGRIFVNYPRWWDEMPFSVAELDSLGDAHPFPDEKMNEWNPSMTAMDHFVCVQSVYVDNENFLWILDPANPGFQGVVEMGPKLMKVDLERNKVVMTIILDSRIAPANSYLNDVRVDTKKKHAYITESGTGAIVVINLESGKPRRVLQDHPSTKAEDITLAIEGSPFEAKVHADGLTLDAKGKYLYYQALTGRTLYRIETKWLRDESLSEAELGAKVERVAESGASDGIAFGRDGHIYFTSLEHNAIRRLTPEGNVEVAVRDDRLRWPDSFAVAHDGTIHVTTAQIHLGPAAEDPYWLFKLVPRKSSSPDEREAP